MISKRLTIFEGVDGAGKTTLAKAFAEATGAHYVHCGPFPRMNRGLARLYVEAMAPAVLGLSDVVMDRCWLSEQPYGDAFRKGQDRLGTKVRLLERLAWRCKTTVVRCDAPWEDIESNFALRGKTGLEYLERADQLKAVYDSYKGLRTSLPVLVHQPRRTMTGTNVRHVLDSAPTTDPHDLRWQTAGNFHADVLLIGQDFAEVQDDEPMLQWPFGSLSGSGCSLWLADKLSEAGIGESKLCWGNSDTVPMHLVESRFKHVVVLGGVAFNTLKTLGLTRTEGVVVVPHPQYHKRFRTKEYYPLLDHLETIT